MVFVGVDFINNEEDIYVLCKIFETLTRQLVKNSNIMEFDSKLSNLSFGFEFELRIGSM